MIGALIGIAAVWFLITTITLVWYSVMIAVAFIAIVIAMILFGVVFVLTSFQGIFSERQPEVEG